MNDIIVILNINPDSRAIFHNVSTISSTTTERTTERVGEMFSQYELPEKLMSFMALSSFCKNLRYSLK